MDHPVEPSEGGSTFLVSVENEAIAQPSNKKTEQPPSLRAATEIATGADEPALASAHDSPDTENEDEVSAEGAPPGGAQIPNEAPPPQPTPQPEVTFSSQPPSPTTHAAADTGIVAKRPSRSGRQAIREASTRTAADTATLGGLLVPTSLNAQYKTIPEEHAEFRARNNVKPTYRGPVFTVEDVSVPCHACGGPVDPVTRVPVGSLFFHVHCLQCFLCGRREGVAGLFVQVDRQAVCSECAARRYESWVPRQEAQSRGMVYGAIQGDVYAAMDAHDRGARTLPRLARPPGAPASAAARNKSKVQPVAAIGASTLNRSTVPGALPPTLTIRPVHNSRNTGRRSFALMERQQYYTQSDNNLLMRAPESETTSSGGGTRRVSKANKVKGAVASQETQQITASRSTD